MPALVLATLATTLAAAPAGAAVGQGTTSMLAGTVADDGGRPLAGVTVRAVESETGRDRSAVTDGDGQFRLPLLPPGRYRVEAVAPGFRSRRHAAVELRLGERLELQLRLEPVALQEVVVVTGEAPPLDVRTAAVSTSVDAATVEALPVLGRDFSDFALLTPGAVVETHRETLALGGQRGVATAVSVDGASANSAWFGYQRGGTDAPFTLSLASVREFRVVTSAVAPEHGRSGGALVDVVTRSGTNRWRAGAHLFGRHDSLVADDPFGRPQREFAAVQAGAHVGGPLARNRSFLFLSADLQERDTPFFVDFGVDDERLERLRQRIAAAGRPEIRLTEGRQVETDDVRVGFLKWSQRIGDRHDLTLRANASRHETLEGGAFEPAVTTAFDLSALGDQTESTLSTVLQLTSRLGPDAYNDLRVQYALDDLDRDPNDPLGPQTNVLSPFLSFGRAFFLPIRTHETKWQVQNGFTYLFGDHDLQVGFDVEHDRVADFFAGLAAGWYFFSDLDAFLESRPLFLRQGFVDTRDPNYDAAQTMAAAWVQDTWQAAPRLTVSYGLRWEGTFNPTPPGNPELPQTGRIPDDRDNWQPRLGLAWGLDESTVVRGSAGLFHSRTPNVLFFNAFQSNGTPGRGVHVVPGSELEGLWPATFESATGAPGEQEIYWFDPGYEEARTLRLSVGIERALSENSSLGLSWVHARADGLQRLYDRNLRAAGVDADGRLLYAHADGRPLRPVPGARFRVVDDDGHGRYDALTLSFRRRFSGTFGLMGSYTWARDRDNDSNERAETGRQPSDIFDPDADYGASDRDVRHRLVVAGYADLPGTLRLAGVLTARSGLPFDARLPVDANFDGDPANDRPAIGGRVVGRNAFRQPAFVNLDLRLSRRLEIGAAGRLEVLVEAYNVLGRDNLAVSGGHRVWGTPQFAVPDTVAGNLRQLQLGLRWRR